MDDRQYTQLMAKLDSMLKLQALGAVNGKPLKEQVSLLASLGFQPKQIAELLGKTPNHISVILHDIRKVQKSQEVQPENQLSSQAGDAANG